MFESVFIPARRRHLAPSRSSPWATKIWKGDLVLYMGIADLWWFSCWFCFCTPKPAEGWGKKEKRVKSLHSWGSSKSAWITRPELSFWSRLHNGICGQMRPNQFWACWILIRIWPSDRCDGNGYAIIGHSWCYRIKRMDEGLIFVNRKIE